MAYARKTRRSVGRVPRRRRRNFTRVPTKKVSFAYKKSIKRAIAVEVAKGRENKYAARVVRPTTIPAAIAQNQTLNVFPVMPEISQGTGEYGNRIGNKVSPKYMNIRGWCTLDMTDSNKDYDRVAMRIMVGFVKQYPLFEDAEAAVTGSPLNNWSYRLLDGGAAPSAFTGTLDAYQAPVNRDVFTCKAQRRFTLMRPRIWDAPLTGDDFARSTAGSYKFFSIRVKCPKVLNYAQASDARPRNFAPVLLAGYTLLNGAVPGNPITSPKQVTISYTTRLSYEDA